MGRLDSQLGGGCSDLPRSAGKDAVWPVERGGEGVKMRLIGRRLFVRLVSITHLSKELVGRRGRVRREHL